MTNNRSTRAEQTRTNTERDYVYMPPSEMEIPNELKNKFSEQGFSLRWVRFLLGNEEDYKNIGLKEREGYIFVTTDEVGEYLPMVRTASTKNHNGLVTVGDLALAKIPTYKAEARKRYYEQKTRELEQATRRDVRRTSDARMDRLTPLFDESKSRIQVKTFAPDED